MIIIFICRSVVYNVICASFLASGSDFLQTKVLIIKGGGSAIYIAIIGVSVVHKQRIFSKVHWLDLVFRHLQNG